MLVVPLIHVVVFRWYVRKTLCEAALHRIISLSTVDEGRKHGTREVTVYIYNRYMYLQRCKFGESDMPQIVRSLQFCRFMLK